MCVTATPGQSSGAVSERRGGAAIPYNPDADVKQHLN